MGPGASGPLSWYATATAFYALLYDYICESGVNAGAEVFLADGFERLEGAVR